MQIAAIDCGSNSLKCLIAEKRGEDFICLKDLRFQTRLASALNKKDFLSSTAQDRTIAILKNLQENVFSLHENWEKATKMNIIKINLSVHQEVLV